MNTEKNIICKFNCDATKRILCSFCYDGFLYFGTSQDGTVYRTNDGYNISEFYKTNENLVYSICEYGGALFIGTSGGNIYMHNFNTGNRFHYLSTGDYGISSMCVNKDILYIATKPNGSLISFDSNNWKYEYTCSGNGIVKLESYKDNLFVFASDICFIPVYDGLKWEVLKNGDENFSILSFNKSIISTSYNINKNFDEYYFTAAKSIGDKLYFAFSSNCNLYSYDGKNVKIEYQWSGNRITNIGSTDDTQIFVCVDGKVYFGEIK